MKLRRRELLETISWVPHPSRSLRLGWETMKRGRWVPHPCDCHSGRRSLRRPKSKNLLLETFVARVGYDNLGIPTTAKMQPTAKGHPGNETLET
jgi:hypothetical protein